MKKMIEALLVVLLGCSCCCAQIYAQTGTAKPSDHEEAFQTLLAQQQAGDLNAVPRALRFFGQNMKGAEQALVDRCFVAFDRFMDRVVLAENEAFQEVPFPGQEALYDLQGKGHGGEGTASPEQKRYLNRLAAMGLSLEVDTGSYEVQKDEAFLLKVLGGRVSEPLKSFLEQRAREYQEGFWRDGALTITPRVVAERILFWESFLRENPCFVGAHRNWRRRSRG